MKDNKLIRFIFPNPDQAQRTKMVSMLQDLPPKPSRGGHMGTPQTLEQAIEAQLSSFCFIENKPEIAVQSIKYAVIDFLSQHFTPPMIEHEGTQTGEVLKILWNRIKAEKLKNDAK